jgi:hypothetical protein
MPNEERGKDLGIRWGSDDTQRESAFIGCGDTLIFESPMKLRAGGKRGWGEGL